MSVVARMKSLLGEASKDPFEASTITFDTAQKAADALMRTVNPKPTNRKAVVKAVAAAVADSSVLLQYFKDMMDKFYGGRTVGGGTVMDVFSGPFWAWKSRNKIKDGDSEWEELSRDELLVSEITKVVKANSDTVDLSGVDTRDYFRIQMDVKKLSTLVVQASSDPHNAAKGEGARKEAIALCDKISKALK